MLSRRGEALLHLRAAGGEEARRLEQLDRILRWLRGVRHTDDEAYMLRLLVEDTVLGMHPREPMKGSPADLRKLLRAYQWGPGAGDPTRIGLEPYRCQVVFDRPRVFISHRHVDKPVAVPLVAMVETAFEISKSDLRCTSVSPHRLAAGDRIGDCLRAEILTAEIMLGLLAPDTRESVSVMFEMGEAYALERPTYPLLVRGATSIDIPAPIRDFHALCLADVRDCEELLDAIEQTSTLRRRGGVGGEVAEKINDLIRVAA
jgi:hypothetical protein